MKFLRRPNHLSITDLFLSFIFSCSVLRVFWLVLLGVIKLIFISVILDGFIINPLTRFNFYKEDKEKLFKSEMFKSLLKSIDLVLINKIEENSESDEQDESEDDD